MLAFKVRQFIEAHGLIAPGERVLVGFSGGPDSACLLLLLREIAPQTAALYVNHNLRGDESAQEEAFVRKFCADQDITLFVESIRWRNKPSNLEEAARRRRYRCFTKVASVQNFHKVALAHHRDDVVETLLQRLLRGSGPSGLAGIAARRAIFIRPLLECWREEILLYLNEKNLAYFTDSSNRNKAFQRNQIRHDLIPYLEKNFNSAIRPALARTSRWIGEQNELLAELIQPYASLIVSENGRWKLERKAFDALSEPVKKAVLRLVLKAADPSLRPGSRTLSALMQSISDGKNLELPGFLMVESTRESILLASKDRSVGAHEIDVPDHGNYYFAPGDAHLTFSTATNASFSNERNVVFLDAEKASFPLYIRNWKRGDSFRPLGMTGTKKLSDFLIDRKVARNERKKIPLVFKDDDLVWVAGHQLNNDYRITTNTKAILRIECKKRHV